MLVCSELRDGERAVGSLKDWKKEDDPRLTGSKQSCNSYMFNKAAAVMDPELDSFTDPPALI